MFLIILRIQTLRVHGIKCATTKLTKLKRSSVAGLSYSASSTMSHSSLCRVQGRHRFLHSAPFLLQLSLSSLSLSPAHTNVMRFIKSLRYTRRKPRILQNILRKSDLHALNLSRSIFACSHRNTHKLFDRSSHRDTTSLAPEVALANQMADEPLQFSSDFNQLLSWTSKISTSVKTNQPDKAIGLFKLMLRNDHRPNFVTLLSVIKAIGLLNWASLVQMIHGLVIKMGFGSQIAVVTSLMKVYTLYDTEDVYKLFEKSPSKDLVLWSAMVSAFVKNGQFLEALECFRGMQCYELEPNEVSSVSILPACAHTGALSLGKQVHAFCIRRVFTCYTNVQNSLVDMYAKCGKLEDAVRVFKWIQEKDLVSWKTMICGCLENSYHRKALVMLSEMRSSWFEPDETIIQEALCAVSRTEEAKLGMGIHSYVLKSGFLAFVSVGTALLQMYAKFGEGGSARSLFDQFHDKDLIAWSAMISVHAQSGDYCDALHTFKQMQLANEMPNEITFLSLLQACTSGGAKEIGESIQAYLIQAGYLYNTFITSALIDFYSKFGRIRQARAVFDNICNKDLICWSSMINGYGLNGFGSEAEQTFQNMLDCGIMPNDVVFISLLSACSHCGLDNEGWRWFYSMEVEYGIPPKLAHYACMVDLLSRRGNIEEAFQFVNKMPMEPDERIWGSLLSGCRISHGYHEIAEVAANHLLTMDPSNASYYVNLSNLYGEQGKWGDVERLRRLVDGKELKKITGYSII